jgi:transposase
MAARWELTDEQWKVVEPILRPARRGDISLSRRWLVEKGFGWLKQTGPLRQVKLRGLEKVDWLFVFSCAAHNLLRLPRLSAAEIEKGD